VSFRRRTMAVLNDLSNKSFNTSAAAYCMPVGQAGVPFAHSRRQ